MDTRTVVAVAGLGHGDNPIPLATRKGPLLASGGIFGLDPATGTVPEEFEAQVVLMFANVRRVLEAAGGSPGDIIKMTVWTRARGGKDLLNREWTAMFPDPQSRPARHSLINEHMPPPLLIQCDVLAVLG
ncbi:MAG TPA: RidA family protein [Azospirillum sp.]|nr:RidA family protein [Azospirillum sp.]